MTNYRTTTNQNSKDSKRGKQPSAAAKQRVRDAFDADTLIDICERDASTFTDYAHRVDLEPRNGRERFFYYVDNGSDILGIAHLDTVQEDRRCNVVDTAAGLIALSGALDDRLGAYVILELLPALGITCDWLLTTDEEIGQSTAAEFWPEHKDYNWMFQFDRGGTDVVLYEYETPAYVELVEKSSAAVGQGIFSDICCLEHLACAGFNWGVGYQDYHSTKSHAWLEDTFRMVARFEKFHRANHDTYLPHDMDARFEKDWDEDESYTEWWRRQEKEWVDIDDDGDDDPSDDHLSLDHDGEVVALNIAHEMIDQMIDPFDDIAS